MRRAFSRLLVLIIVFAMALSMGDAIAPETAFAAEANELETANVVSWSDPVVIKSVKAKDDGIVVKWKQVVGAKGYRVFRRTETGKWKVIAKNVTSKKYKDETAKSGKTYYYSVRAYRGKYKKASKNTYSPECWSGFDETGTAAFYLKAPSMKSTEKRDGGVKVKWKSVDGATSYTVYRKNSSKSGKTSGDWKEIGTVTGTGLLDVTANTSGSYYYTVSASNGSVSSGYGSNKATYGVDKEIKEKERLYSKIKSKGSSTKYIIAVDCKNCYVGIYQGSKDNWKLIKLWRCSTGKSSTPTVIGTFHIGSKGYSFVSGNSTLYYWSQFYGNYLFHSILYKKGTWKVSNATTGKNLSHGCVRLAAVNAKWIYKNCGRGTTVVTFR